MEKIKEILSKRENVDPIYLDYIGKTEVRDFDRFDIYYFNILDPNHKRYKSTIAYKDIFYNF